MVFEWSRSVQEHPDDLGIREAFQEWRAAPFPPGSEEDDQLDELRCQLIYVDAMIADTVIPYAEGSTQLDDIPDQAREKLQNVLSQTRDYPSMGDHRVEVVAAACAHYARLMQRLLAEIDRRRP